MKYKVLYGNSIKEDIEEIKRNIDEDASVVFIYSGTETLYDYIDALYDKGQGLDDEYLYKFKVCYEKKDLKVSYSSRNENRSITIDSMSSLVNEMDGKNSCKIVVEGNDRVQLAFIVQQLIFVEYPIEKVDILLRKEEKDADKTKRFMKNVNELLNGCEKAITRLISLRHEVETEMDDNNPTKEERLKDIDDALTSCTSIKSQILKSIDVELKFAVAASKKAGKSVIVNCFLGEQIAPTSTELATPNNCIYKKSSDGLYHLQLEGDAQQDFDTREEIYDVINGHFRSAQNDKEHGFALPDMYIGYVTDENNFSSYTIFDTAGPDAAGTVHAEVADKAMQKCDVAVFAIDYSKYLTPSEEDYLRRVKKMFTAQNKFHSLLFALNKIDVRYTDAESPKSFVKSVDFLKKRLADIDEAYRDCIIFPTCSKEFYGAIEAEKAGVSELNKENEFPIERLQELAMIHKKDAPELAWLANHAFYLKYYHGLKTVSYDVFKKDSGMPALMSYVSYVAQSKARDEIVNSVTFEIASQKMKIQGVLNYISCIEALINADDEKISEISGIITDYTDAVKEILRSDFSQEDLAVLPDNGLLRLFNGDYNKFIDNQRRAVESTCEQGKVADAMYADAVEVLYKIIKGVNGKNGYEIDSLFTADDFKSIANRLAKAKVEDAAKGTFDTLSKLSLEVKQIVENRQSLLKKQSDICKERLLKEHIPIELPEFPEFEFATPLTSPSEIIVQVSSIDFNLYDKFSDLFKKKFLSKIGNWFSRKLGSGTHKDAKFKFNATKEEFRNSCKRSLMGDFKYAVVQNNIPQEMSQSLTNSVVDQYMNSLLEEIKQSFESMNSTYLSCIERFSSAVDDRDKYKAEIELYNLRKGNIMSIDDCTKEFMDTWSTVIQDFIDDVETEKTPVLV